MLTDEFKREPRYVVLKISDLEKYCSPQARIRVGEVSNFIRHARRFDGRPDLECVVVESDWPEFEPTWAAIEARMTSRAIEAEVLQAQEPVNCPHCDGTGDVHSPDGEWRGECNCGAAHESAKAKFDRLMGDEKETPIERLRFFCSLAMAGQDWIDVEPFFDALSAPQPPAPCQKCAQHEIDFALEHDDKLELQSKVAEQSAEIERLTTYKTDTYAALQKKNDELDALQSTIAQQAERIAELEKVAKAYEDQVAAHNKTLDEVARLSAMIEKCEKALASAVEWGVPMRDAPKSSRPYWFDDSVTALAAIAAHKKGE